MVSEPDDEWLVMVDGAARGNPGPAGCGAVIVDGKGVIVQELSRYLGRCTNNVAEYEGLLMGLAAVLQLGKKRIRVQSDSQLMVRQLNGAYRVKDEKLKPLFQQAVALLRQFESYRILDVSRELNRLADRLANKGIDDAIKKSSRG
ncbi:MAG TPA: ribonuclease HI family protein [Candidatus Binatia bacterium]|nr:ribonuclease HI family protein [Candidatus Binatia bacterium]